MNVTNYLRTNVSLEDRFFAYINLVKNYIHFMKLYKKRYKNFVSIILNILRNNYPIEAVSNSGDSLLFNDYQELYNNLMGLDIDPIQDLVYINGLKFFGGKTSGDISNVFKMNEYSFLPVEGMEVVDVGANIGDSSIYFAKRRAIKVVAVEPDRVSYDYGIKNIMTNGFSRNINLIWAGCSSQNVSNSKNELEFLTLETIIKKYCSCPEILKVDCEGCEYDLILNASNDDLRRFTHIQIEYHFGYQNLKIKLEECGFEVTYTTPSYFIPLNRNRTTRLVLNKEVSQATRMIIGWLYATRKQINNIEL